MRKSAREIPHWNLFFFRYQLPPAARWQPSSFSSMLCCCLLIPTSCSKSLHKKTMYACSASTHCFNIGPSYLPHSSCKQFVGHREGHFPFYCSRDSRNWLGRKVFQAKMGGFLLELVFLATNLATWHCNVLLYYINPLLLPFLRILCNQGSKVPILRRRKWIIIPQQWCIQGLRIIL